MHSRKTFCLGNAFEKNLQLPVIELAKICFSHKKYYSRDIVRTCCMNAVEERAIIVNGFREKCFKDPLRVPFIYPIVFDCTTCSSCLQVHVNNP